MSKLYLPESSASAFRKALPLRWVAPKTARALWRCWIWLLLGRLLLGPAAAGDATASTAARPVPPAIEQSVVEASGRQLDISSDQSAVLTTRLPVETREKIVIKDMDGNVVRTLVDRRRPPGAYEDSWDGKGENGGRLKDGQYRWVARFDDGLRSFTIDRSSKVDGDFELKSHAEYPAWDAFNNVPLRVTHTFERPGEIVLVFSHETYYVVPACDPPEFFCRFLDGYQPAGEFRYEWAGVDDTGALRPDLHAIFVISHHEKLSENAIVIYGGAPKVTGVTVTPSAFRPDFGLQEVAFWLATYEGEHVSAEITFTNQESRSALRKISLTNVAPGRVKATWDGRADGGMRVAPGLYTVTVRVTDSLGQRAMGEILTAIEF